MEVSEEPDFEASILMRGAVESCASTSGYEEPDEPEEGPAMRCEWFLRMYPHLRYRSKLASQNTML